MTVANMLIVSLSFFNEQKRADRLQHNEVIVMDDAVGILESADFVDTGLDHPALKLRVKFVHKANGKSPIAQEVTTERLVLRDQEFTVLGVLAK